MNKLSFIINLIKAKMSSDKRVSSKHPIKRFVQTSNTAPLVASIDKSTSPKRKLAGSPKMFSYSLYGSPKQKQQPSSQLLSPRGYCNSGGTTRQAFN